MSNDGFVKVEISDRQRVKFIRFVQQLMKDYNRCLEMNLNGEFYVTEEKQFLFFFKKITVRFDKQRCEDAFPELFRYVYIMMWSGIPSFHETPHFNNLLSMLDMLKSPGDVYFTPFQCAEFRRITDASDDQEDK